MKSMTGFGTQAVELTSFEYEITIKSVNGRFLEVRFHMPRDLISLESELRKSIEKTWHRGTVDVFINQRALVGGSRGEVRVDRGLAESYVKALGVLSKVKGIKKELLSLSFVSKLPEVLSVVGHSGLSTVEKLKLMTAFKKTIDLCNKERTREGLHIKKDLQVNIRSLSKFVSEIKEFREEVNAKLAQKFEEKVKLKVSQLAEPFEVDSQRLMQEIVLQLEKTDINEELTRLEEHMRNYLEVAEADGAIGKKLDFYTQELLREMNTIGSKSNVSQLTQTVINAKTVIERLREQVQNIE